MKQKPGPDGNYYDLDQKLARTALPVGVGALPFQSRPNRKPFISSKLVSKTYDSAKLLKGFEMTSNVAKPIKGSVGFDH